MTRRDVLKTTGFSTFGLFIPGTLLLKTQEASKFSFCLNASTLRAQTQDVTKFIDIAARAGYDSIELWVTDIKTYLNENKSIKSLKKLISDNKISVANAIGFAPWMVDDDEQRNAGFKQMEEEMDLISGLGCRRIAAPAAGVQGNKPVDLFKAGERYRQLLELGRKTGVMPQLEFWGSGKVFYHLGQTLMVLAVADDSDGRILADVFHLYRGGSGFEGLKLVNGKVIEIFHMNDYPGTIPREQLADGDRVYPGDGIAPMHQIINDLNKMEGTKILSLELFNKNYWKQDPLLVAKTGINKMRELVRLSVS